MSTAIEVRGKDRARARNQVYQRVQGAIAEIAPELAAGRAGAGLTVAQLHQVLALLRKGESASQLDLTKQQLRSLDSQLRALQRATNGPVATPAVPVTIGRKSSPFTEGAFNSLLQLRELITKFLADLETDNSEPVHRAGQIICSAVVFGGLTHLDLVRALPNAIEMSAYAHEDLFWLDIKIDEAGSDENLRRWFPDPVTQCLILRWRAAGAPWPKLSVDALLWKLMRALDMSFGTKGFKLHALISASITRLRVDMPGVLVDFLSSTQKGQSLPPRAWWRVLCDHQLTLAVPENSDAPELLSPESTPVQPVLREASDDLSELTRLQRALRNPAGGGSITIGAAQKGIERLRETTAGAPMICHLMDWAVWMIQGRSGTRCKPSSAARYLNAFGRALIALAGETDPRIQAVEELEAMYEAVLRAIHVTGQRPMASIGLRHFHAYLMIAHDLPPVEIDGVMTADQNVRANTISEKEFLRILDALGSEAVSERNAGLLQAMALLLYRLGLRRSELAWIRVEDIQVDECGARPLLWIHNHPSSGVKTHSSKRRLPLAHLMSREDAERVLSWRNRRITELGRVAPKTALLFCERGADTTRLDDKFIDTIVDVARLACGDETIVMHTFRHAFASNLFASIMRAGWRAQHQTTQDNCLPWLSQERQETELRRHFVADRLPRGAIYVLSIHAGHIDPVETMRSYVHHQDIIASLYLKELANNHPNSLWAALEGISEQALRVRRSRDKKAKGSVMPAYCDTPLRLLRAAKIPLPSGQQPAETFVFPAKSIAFNDTFVGVRLDAVYRAISTMAQSMTHNSRTFVTGFDPETNNALLKNARALAAIQTNSRNKNARRARHLKPSSGRRRPSIATRPQLDNIGPALPVRHDALKEARAVFDRATSLDPRIPLEDLLCLLKSTSRSDPVISFQTIDALNKGVETLRLLGITAKQMRVVIRAFPKDQVSAEKWRAKVKKSLASNVAVVCEDRKDGTPTPRSKANHSAGTLVLEVRNAGRRSSGWRVGTYYAVCVLATMFFKDIQ